MNEHLLRGTQYLKFIRSQQYCCVCMQEKNIEPHHLKAIGMGNNRKNEMPEHFTAIPVCRECHIEYHTKGQKYQAEKWNLNHWKESTKYIIKFIYEITKEK